MIKLRESISILATILVVLVFLFSAGAVNAGDPPPPQDPEQSWTPPEGQGGSYMAPGANSKFDASSTPSSSTMAPSSSFYPPPPGMPPSILSANFIDEAGRVRSQFADEPFYLRVQINAPGNFFLAEYYPSGSGMSPQWLMYNYSLNRAGAWTLGPFYSETYEPVGQHTWKLWLYTSGAWAQRLVRFDYQPSNVPYGYPSPITISEASTWGTVQIVIVMVLVGALGITIGMLISSKRRYSS
jgi:hypothetical protein